MSADATNDQAQKEKTPHKDLSEYRIGRDSKGNPVFLTEIKDEVVHHHDSLLTTIAKFLFLTQSGRIIVGSIILLVLLEPEVVQNLAYVVGSSMLGFVIWAVFILGIIWLVGSLAESTKKKWKGVAGGDDHGKKGGHH